MVDSFTLDITAFVKDATENIDVVIRKTLFDLFKKIILRTPVDTGCLILNWLAAIGDQPAGFDSELTGTGGDATVSEISSIIDGVHAGDTVYLVNNTPYAIYIENGHSTVKAPQGMVAVSVQEFPNIVAVAAGGGD